MASKSTSSFTFNNDYPWLLFKLDHNTYAVSSKNIISIATIPSEITIPPNKPDYIRGIITYLSRPIYLFDLRSMLSIPSIEKEYADFKDMLEARKNDHIRWVKELERCVVENDKFTLATDPHKCAFGKWYDKFECDINSINMHLRQMEEPHRLLHEAALEIEKCHEHPDCEKGKICSKEALGRAKNIYMPKILKTLEDAKAMFADNYREMTIIFECDGYSYGIVVNDVMSVEEITFMASQESMGSVSKTDFIVGVGKSSRMKELILLFDERPLVPLLQANLDTDN